MFEHIWSQKKVNQIGVALNGFSGTFGTSGISGTSGTSGGHSFDSEFRRIASLAMKLSNRLHCNRLDFNCHSSNSLLENSNHWFISEEFVRK